VDIDGIPPWFRAAVAEPVDSSCFEARGARLHMLRWNWEGGADRPVLLLVHGFLAHARWWVPIAPLLARDCRLAALDLSGMGDSEARESYPTDWAARDILAAIDFLGIAPATIVGHSFGGASALMASALEPGRIRRVIALDSYFNFSGEVVPGSPFLSGHRHYATLEDALARYRLTPGPADIPDCVLHHVARHSLKSVDDGWSWKFDPALSSFREFVDGASVLREVGAEVDYVYGENSSLIDRQRALRIAESLPRVRSLRVFPDGHHHFLLEHPLRTAQLLQELLQR